MPRQQLASEPPTLESGIGSFSGARVAAVVVIVITLAANAMFLIGAESQPGFGSMLLLLCVSPATNGVLLLIGFVIRLQRRSAGYGIVAFILPALAAGFNVWFLTVMRRY